jgi:DNA-binding response OmpR family regulator
MIYKREDKDPAGRPVVFACEDAPLMREFIITGLGGFGLAVTGVANGRQLDLAMAEVTPDIVILDILLPGEDGYSIAERLRRARPGVGIIMLTARDQVEDRVRGLDCGADLYFAKPIDSRELASAIRSLHRRLGQSAGSCGPAAWRLDSGASCLVTPSGARIHLTDNEHRFLAPLLERPGGVVEREELFRALDQKPDVYAMRRMDTLVSRLRAKVRQASPDESLPVRARHGRGYAFLADGMRP